jgi:hypothetical protein
MHGDVKVEKYVLFSDLHVGKGRLADALLCIKTAFDYAAENDAKVAFLGDWWEVRGSVPVRELNECLSQVSCHPGVEMIMIPGNHDQVSKSGLTHGLEPFGYLDNVKVIDEPTVIGDVLWLPYRRDKRDILEALKEEEGEFTAIFGHLEVVGAKLNNLQYVKKGLQPDDFPDVPIFSGHLHRPHCVTRDGRVIDWLDTKEDAAISFVGSPRQITASETGQKKRLVLVGKDQDGWAPRGRKWIDIGTRHFTLNHEAIIGIDDIRAGDRFRLS